MALAGDPELSTHCGRSSGDLQQACAKEPGIVLADNDAGHYIRYYTQCSVIANNFLLTRQHEDKIRQIDHLRSLSARELPSAAPYVRYVLVRPASIGLLQQGERYTSYSRTAPQLVKDLLLKPLDQVPPNYVLIGQADVRAARPEDSVPYIRLFKIDCPRAQTETHCNGVAESRRSLTIDVTCGQGTSERELRESWRGALVGDAKSMKSNCFGTRRTQWHKACFGSRCRRSRRSFHVPIQESYKC